MPSKVIKIKLNREKMVDRLRIPLDAFDLDASPYLSAIIDYDHQVISTNFKNGELFSTGVSAKNFSKLAGFFIELT